MRSLVVALLLALVAPAAFAAPFSDVPRTHWAYAAIQQAVDAGVLQGFAGKFEGQRLLNRYQMAVIVAKLLDAAKSPAGHAKAAAGDGQTLKNIDALTAEFADELALLATKVTTLEVAADEMRRDLDAMKGGAGGSLANKLGFTAFASVGLVKTDMDAWNAAIEAWGGSGPWPPVGLPLTRYSMIPDSTFFTLPQVSIGVDKEVNPGVFFHAQFDYASDVTPLEAGVVGINEAYFFVDELIGEVGGKIGAFALPFSMETNGPFRTCNLTITPSGVNSWNESWRGYGAEFQPTKDVKPEDIAWKVGIVSGTDLGSGSSLGARWLWSDNTPGINQRGEIDDSFGYYLYVGKKPEKKGFGWQLGYMDNGGDPFVPTSPIVLPNTPTPEVKQFQVGAEWWGDKFGVMAQYLDVSATALSAGPSVPPFLGEYDATLWYVLVNYEFDTRNNVSLRYDQASIDMDPVWASVWPITSYGATGFTVAFNHQVTENSMLQFEYLMPDDDLEVDPAFGPIPYTEADDDLIQLRYKVHF